MSAINLESQGRSPRRYKDPGLRGWSAICILSESCVVSKAGSFLTI